MTLPSAASPRLIRIAAALLISPDGRTLLAVSYTHLTLPTKA